MINLKRLPGISFIMRCHNEEERLELAIRSLKDISIPYEIVLILHCCTDRSKQIAESLKTEFPINLIEYEVPLSRPGYDTLVTPANHPNSIVTHFNYCFSHAQYNWIIKWDAEACATVEMINYINALEISKEEPEAHKLSNLMGDISNEEFYLSNCLIGFAKQIFWEVMVFSHGVKWITPDPMPKMVSLPVTYVKKYWKNARWFLKEKTYDKSLHNKLLALIDICGFEPTGLARASNSECAKFVKKIRENEETLNSHGIYLSQ